MKTVSCIPVLATSLACVTSLASAGGPAEPASANARPGPIVQARAPASKSTFATPIRHIVILVQENRTPDNLFHGLPGADIATEGINSKGEVITLQPVPLASNFGLGHSHNLFVLQYDGGKMDGADKVVVKCNTTIGCPPPNPQFMYVNPSDVAPYFVMAQTYTFGDRMFQSNQGPSFPAHQFLIAATSTPTQGGAYDNDFVSDNPGHPRGPTGCTTAPATERVPLIDPQGVTNKSIYPCFEHATVMDLLDQAGLSWTYYVQDANGIRTAPNVINHLRTGPDWVNVRGPQTQVLTDIAAGQLPNVSWVMPDMQQSDHPSQNDGSGPSWVASIVNAIGNSNYWQDTAVLVTWDDWGGWYDHVAPPIYSSYEDGFRVPLLVVSAYAKKAYVSHVTHDFGSIIHYIESTFGLPSLGYQDAQSDDLSDCFDYTQTVAPFQTIPAPLGAADFIERARTHPGNGADDD